MVIFGAEYNKKTNEPRIKNKNDEKDDGIECIEFIRYWFAVSEWLNATLSAQFDNQVYLRKLSSAASFWMYVHCTCVFVAFPTFSHSTAKWYDHWQMNITHSEKKKHHKFQLVS